MATLDLEALQHALADATKPGGDWSARGLSLTVGDKPDIVRDIIRGNNKNPNAAIVVGLARAMKRDLADFIRGALPQEDVQPGATTKENIWVVGAVANGIWREQTYWGEEDRYTIEVGPSPVKGAERFGLRSEGYSMEKVIPPGSDLECLRVQFGMIEPVAGDLVIVERHNHDLTELTCKRLDIDDDGAWILRCESDRPEFQEPIHLGKPDTDALVDNEIRVIGIVISSQQRHYRRR